MGEFSDMEDLLRKAKRHATLIAWTKVGIVSICTLVGSAFGAGVTAAKYLDQLMTKDQGAKLFEGQQEQLKLLQAGLTRLDGRVAACELREDYQVKDLTSLRADLKDLQLRAGALVRR